VETGFLQLLDGHGPRSNYHMFPNDHAVNMSVKLSCYDAYLIYSWEIGVKGPGLRERRIHWELGS
jgi:hypothetical protein